MKKDSNLDTLRDRENFKKLLAELREKTKQAAELPARVL